MGRILGNGVSKTMAAMNAGLWGIGMVGFGWGGGHGRIGLGQLARSGWAGVAGVVGFGCGGSSILWLELSWKLACYASLLDRNEYVVT